MPDSEHSERILSDQRTFKSLIPLSKKILCYIETKSVDDISSSDSASRVNQSLNMEHFA